MYRPPTGSQERAGPAYCQPGSEELSLTSEQLEASRAERLRQNGHGTITLEEARTWIEETGLCLFLPKRQFGSSITPTFVEAVCGQRNQTPDPKQIALAEEMLVRMEKEGIVVRLNLQGQMGEQPDYVVAAWVLPYVYALRGDRDWRRSPQLTGSRQVSPLAVQVYKLLEATDSTVAELRHGIGREVTEAAVARAITELWQQLRIIPMISAPGEPARWQLLRHRFQKAIAEGASTSQVTAISVLASIYLQAVIAASMEDVEVFLSALTARSKVREVIRGLVATRQVHTLALGHAPHFYVAGTLPEFATTPTYYASSTIGSSSYFLSREEEDAEASQRTFTPPPAAEPAQPAVAQPAAEVGEKAPEAAPAHKPAHQPAHKPAERPRFSRPASHDRKPAAGSRPARQSSSDERPRSARPSSARSTGSRPAGARPGGSRPAGSRPAGARPSSSRSAASHSAGSHSASSRPASSRPAGPRPTGSRPASSRPASARPAGSRPAGSRPAARPAGSRPAGSRPAGHGAHASKPAVAGRAGKPATKPQFGKSSAKPAGKAPAHKAAPARGGSRKPGLGATKSSGGANRFSHSSSARPGAKKRG